MVPASRLRRIYVLHFSKSTCRWEVRCRHYFSIQVKPNLGRPEQVIFSRLRLWHFPCNSYLNWFMARLWSVHYAARRVKQLSTFCSGDLIFLQSESIPQSTQSPQESCELREWSAIFNIINLSFLWLGFMAMLRFGRVWAMLKFG